jgi:hypothetical protein
VQPSLMDPSILAYVDSLRRAAHHGDSLGLVLQAYDATRDHWIAALQAQTAIFSLITGAIVALAVAINWGVLQVYIKRASKAETRRLDARLDALAKDLDNRTRTAIALARKDACAAWAKAAMNVADWSSFAYWNIETSACLAALNHCPQAESLLELTKQALTTNTGYRGMPSTDYTDLLKQVDSIRGMEHAKKTVKLAEEVLAVVRLEHAEPAAAVIAGKDTGTKESSGGPSEAS